MPRRNRRKKDPVPNLPRTVQVRAAGRVVAEAKTGDGVWVLPGSVLLLCDPDGLSGADREKAAADLVRKLNGDPKTDHERAYQLLWGHLPWRGP